MGKIAIHIILLSALLIAFTQSEPIEIGRYYHIESVDGSILTIGGGNSRDVRVVTEAAQGTNPRQKFVLGSGETHEIRPEAQNAFSNLVLDLELPSGLLFQQHRRFLRTNQWWRVTPIHYGKYVVENGKNGHCLTSNGPNNQVSAGLCDPTSANQTWSFIPALL